MLMFFLISSMGENASIILFNSTYALPDDKMHIPFNSDFEKIVPFVVKLAVILCKLSNIGPLQDHNVFRKNHVTSY